MIILHSKKILEQLSEIEQLISKIESYMDENGMDREKEVKDREAAIASRIKNEN